MNDQKLITKTEKLRSKLERARHRHDLKKELWSNRIEFRKVRYHFFFDMLDDLNDAMYYLRRFCRSLYPNHIITRRYVIMENDQTIEVEDAKQEFDLLKNCELNFDNYSLTNL